VAQQSVCARQRKKGVVRVKASKKKRNFELGGGEKVCTRHTFQESRISQKKVVVSMGRGLKKKFWIDRTRLLHRHTHLGERRKKETKRSSQLQREGEEEPYHLRPAKVNSVLSTFNRRQGKVNFAHIRKEKSRTPVFRSVEYYEVQNQIR